MLLKPAAPKRSAAKPARKQPEQPVLTEHPVQAPAVAASVLPAETPASAVPAVSEPAAVPAVAVSDIPAAPEVSEASEMPEGDAAATAKRRRSRR
ncbi:hypothetical protein [uncultured Bilophila sp.]|uniref:hypothetical protein n=1 Tax=uncultured Bilophila sp. TaxID=529385 RepID=UPI00280B1442|nr:hypothetical protein [uncultured Bilophila sp.]